MNYVNLLSVESFWRSSFSGSERICRNTEDQRDYAGRGEEVREGRASGPSGVLHAMTALVNTRHSSCHIHVCCSLHNHGCRYLLQTVETVEKTLLGHRTCQVLIAFLVLSSRAKMSLPGTQFSFTACNNQSNYSLSSDFGIPTIINTGIVSFIANE